jgi:hypothetical protein
VEIPRARRSKLELLIRTVCIWMFHCIATSQQTHIQGILPGSRSLSLNFLHSLSLLIEKHFTSNGVTTFAKGSTGYNLVSINLKVNHEINKSE